MKMIKFIYFRLRRLPNLESRIKGLGKQLRCAIRYKIYYDISTSSYTETYIHAVPPKAPQDI